MKELGIGMFEITGGEPFSRPDLYQILNIINDLGLHFYVVTNGYFLSNSSSQLIKALKKGLGVAISLDGIGETHDKVRRKKGLYDRILKGIDVLFNEGIKIFLISTLNEKNSNDVEGLLELAQKYQTTIHLRPAIMTGAALANNLKFTDLKVKLGHLLKHPNAKNGLLSTKKSIPKSKYYGCGLRKRISVDSFGTLYPCVMDRNRYLKDIRNYSQESLIDSLGRETKRFLDMNNNCKNCEYNKKEIRCGGFCRFSNSFKKELV